MKSGYCTIMWNGRDHGASEMNHHQPHQRQVFIQRKWCCVYGGIGRESSIMSFFQKTKWLIPTSTPKETKWKQAGSQREICTLTVTWVLFKIGKTWNQPKCPSTGWVSKMWCVGFPGGTVVENLPANAGDTGSCPGLGRSHMLRSNWAREPQLLKPACLEPVLRNKRSHRNEKPAHHSEE